MAKGDKWRRRSGVMPVGEFRKRILQDLDAIEESVTALAQKMDYAIAALEDRIEKLERMVVESSRNGQDKEVAL